MDSNKRSLTKEEQDVLLNHVEENINLLSDKQRKFFFAIKSNIQKYNSKEPVKKEVDKDTRTLNKIKGLIEEVKEIKDHFVVVTNDGEYEASSVIIATGQSPKRLHLENEEKMLGRGISFCAICDGSFYKNKDVIVVGGGNSAIEESLYLSSICKNVYVLVRNQLRADELIAKELKEKENVKIMLNTKPLEYLFDDSFLGIKTNNGEILASGCFLYVGNVPNTSFVPEEIKDEYGYIITALHMETKIKGLYAVGDCREKELRQIVTATSDGAIAASTIKKTLGE